VVLGDLFENLSRLKIEECWQRGHIAARFYEIDTLEQIRWTFFLTGRSP